MTDLGEFAQVVSALGSLLIAGVAIVMNALTTRATLQAQRVTSSEQLAEQRAALAATLSAQAQQIRDERLWDRRIAMYEDLGAWSGEAYQETSRLLFAVGATADEANFWDGFSEHFMTYTDRLGGPYFPLLGRVQLYGSEAERDALLQAAPSITRLAGRYDKKHVSDWVYAQYGAVTQLQEVLRVSVAGLKEASR